MLSLHVENFYGKGVKCQCGFILRRSARVIQLTGYLWQKHPHWVPRRTRCCPCEGGSLFQL